MCCGFEVLCEYGLYTDWNGFKYNVGSSKKKCIFWHFGNLCHVLRYETILKPLLISLHRTMGLKLPLIIS